MKMIKYIGALTVVMLSAYTLYGASPVAIQQAKVKADKLMVEAENAASSNNEAELARIKGELKKLETITKFGDKIAAVDGMINTIASAKKVSGPSTSVTLTDDQVNELAKGMIVDFFADKASKDLFYKHYPDTTNALKNKTAETDMLAQDLRNALSGGSDLTAAQTTALANLRGRLSAQLTDAEIEKAVQEAITTNATLFNALNAEATLVASEYLKKQIKDGNNLLIAKDDVVIQAALEEGKKAQQLAVDTLAKLNEKVTTAVDRASATSDYDDLKDIQDNLGTEVEKECKTLNGPTIISVMTMINPVEDATAEITKRPIKLNAQKLVLIACAASAMERAEKNAGITAKEQDDMITLVKTKLPDLVRYERSGLSSKTIKITDDTKLNAENMWQYYYALAIK